MSKRSSQIGSIHVVVTICLVLALLTALGWIFWQNFLQKADTQSHKDMTTKTQTSQAKDKPVIRTTTFTSSKHLLRFDYPTGWLAKENITTDESDWYASSTTISNNNGMTLASLGTGGEFGGACDPASPSYTATTIDDTPLQLKGLQAVHYGYTIIEGTNKQYDIFYGLNDGSLPKGTTQVQCPGIAIGYKYIVHVTSENKAISTVTFGSWGIAEGSQKSFNSIDEAKAYASSDDMQQVKTMVSSLSIGG